MIFFCRYSNDVKEGKVVSVLNYVPRYEDGSIAELSTTP
jgi:hypothetical protein